MNSQVTSGFLQAYKDLPDGVKARASQCYRVWLANPSHPGLHFKKIKHRDSLYSVRIGIGWRALGLLEDDTVTWFWIGTHADYDRLIA